MNYCSLSSQGGVEYNANLLREIWAIESEAEREKHVRQFRGKTITITGKVQHAGGGLGQEPYLLMEVKTGIFQTSRVLVHFDDYDGSGRKFYFRGPHGDLSQGDLLAEITLPPLGDVVRIKKGQPITVTGVISWYPPSYHALSITGAFLQLHFFEEVGQDLRWLFAN